MQEAGVQLLQNIDELAVVGISEVLLHWKAIRQAFHTMGRFIREKRPRLVILIDYPDFNLRLAKVARRERVKVLYYISPQVWAWRSGRIKTIARNVDTLLVVFPFEPPLYQGTGLDVRFIGHPLVDMVRPGAGQPGSEQRGSGSPGSGSPGSGSPGSGREEECLRLGVNPDRPIIGLLPGSRKSEISRLLPQLIGAARKIVQKRPDVQFLLALASTIRPAEVEPYLRDLRELDPSVQIHCRENSTYDIIQLSDLVLVTSGTATLETALLNTPMILVYRLSLFSYVLGRLLIRVPCIGLVNLVAGRKIVPELIQYQANPDRIASVAEEIMENPRRRESMRRELLKIKDKLGDPGSSGRAAGVVMEMLGREPLGNGDSEATVNQQHRRLIINGDPKTRVARKQSRKYMEMPGQ